MVGVVSNLPVPIVVVWLPSPSSITLSSSCRLAAAAMRAAYTNGVSAVCRGVAGVGWIVAVAAAAGVPVGDGRLSTLLTLQYKLMKSIFEMLR